MPDGTKWGVYVDPQPSINPSANTLTGSGQITMVAPLNFAIVDFNSVSGFWSNNAIINGPLENPTKSYISFGLNNDIPKIVYSQTAPTLLFTFRKASNFCPGALYLIENGVDPFDDLPNSANSNPGNEITVLDFATMPLSIYEYGENFAPFAWDCHDCDGDGIANAYEDTNGDGEWTPGVDASDLCNGGGGCLDITAAQLHCAGGGTACGNNPAGPLSLAVDITGGLAPFTLKYTDGSAVLTLQNYQSGSPFPVAAVNGAAYSLVEVTGADGCTTVAADLSGEVPVTIPGALQFAAQPTNMTLCNGTAAMFTTCASATNGTFSFGWQYSTDQGTTWQPVPMGIIFNQTNTATAASGCDTLLIGSTIGLQGYRFRAVASGTNVPTAYSQAGTLALEGPLQLTAQWLDVTVCAGDGATFTASFTNNGVGTIAYQWQTSTNGGVSWTDVAPSANFSGINTASLAIGSTVGMGSSHFRLRAKVGACNPVFTLPSQLIVEGPVDILAIISPVTVCRGEEACFEVQAALQGSGLLGYQWQERQIGASNWTDIPGATASIFCLANTEGRNGNCFRALVRSSACPAVTSVEACLIVGDKAVFAQQPENIVKCVGEAATLTALAAIADGYAGQVEYRWQMSADGGLNWQDLNNDATYDGVLDGTLTISDLSALGNQTYRLSASSGICEAAYSNAASITVEGPVAIGQQPQGLTVCPGSTASFMASASNLGAGSLLLQWQASDNGTVWANIAEGSNYTGTLTSTLTVQSATIGRQFRLSASTDHCAATYSDPAALTVEAPILFSQQPQGATVCPDEAASFTIAVSGGSGALQLQWQSSANGQTWSDIAEGGNYAGTHTTTLTIAEAAGLGGSQYRLVAASQNCTSHSAAAVLTLEDEATCNPVPGYQDCVSLSVKRLDDNIGWSVWAKADSSFTETPYQLPTGGKVTLVAPIGFAVQGLASHNGGKWKPGKVSFNPPQDPGKVFLEFNLTPNQNFLELTPGAERLLFSFSVVGGCPESLVLMDEIVPPGFFRNEFTGFGSGLTQEEIPFHFCGNYAQDEWECPPTWNLMAPTGGSTVAEGEQLKLDPSAVQVDFPSENGPSLSFFGVAPNPTRGELTVAFDENIAEQTASLRLWNLQGQLLLSERIEGVTNRRLDLSQMTPGTYFLTLEVDGKLVQREKIIVL